MKPEKKSQLLLGVTRSNAKMIEFGVPQEHRIDLKWSPTGLFPLTIGILGDFAAQLSRGGENQSLVATVKQELRFSACFLDAFQQGRSEQFQDTYLTLITAAAYYLCELPGSSLVMIKTVEAIPADTDPQGLKRTLLWLLKGKFDSDIKSESAGENKFLKAARTAIVRFYTDGNNPERALRLLKAVRKQLYKNGGDRDLLLADLLLAVTRRRFDNSSRNCLPRFSGVSITDWEPALRKPTFVQEFWPAQRLLGEHNIFRGRSAIVQMPTSAGKTKATEILIRASFLSARSSLAVVVAPFRALCHEIRDSMLVAFHEENALINEISDVPQSDFDLEIKNGRPQVLILTPEKLFYLLRQKPELATHIGLLIYDEGHQFDSGIRGVTYELLVSSLKKVVPKTCQVILISAVISNAAAISTWLNGKEGIVVTGTDLHPSLKSIAFASWKDALGRLEFLGQSDSANQGFYVPRLIQAIPLKKFSIREKERNFPNRDDEESVALYLALKLAPKGSLAIFCGKKTTVTSICKLLADIYKRNLPMEMPAAVSDLEECRRIRDLLAEHVGADDCTTKCAELGVFTHHSVTPVGVRLAIEYAMKHGLIRVVICTSTLAQGVNLPIRYLLITGVYQGERPISVRDFQNLMGRAGRSGMHTEGSVIFADPSTYDKREIQGDGQRNWLMVESLLDPTKAEGCASSLLCLLDPIQSENRREERSINAPVFYKSYLESIKNPVAFVDDLLSEFKRTRHNYSTKDILKQLEVRFRIIEALESFMMDVFAAENEQTVAEAATQLAIDTLAYELANPEQRKSLVTIFQLVAKRVFNRVPDANKRRFFSKSLLGIETSLHISLWIAANEEKLVDSKDDTALIAACWPLLAFAIHNRLFRVCTQPQALLTLAILWIGNSSMKQILDHLQDSDVRFGDGPRPRFASISHVVELCESGLGYEGTLVISAVLENLKAQQAPNDTLIARLEHLQKRLKYGLSSTTAVVLYEMGFCDRMIAAKLAQVIGGEITDRYKVSRALRDQKEAVDSLLKQFPTYYSFVWKMLLRKEASNAG